MKVVKKILSLLVSAFAVLIVSGFLSLRPVGNEFLPGESEGGDFPVLAHHAADHACNDVTGAAAGVPSPGNPGRNAGVEDSGNFDFNADPPALSYQTCAETEQSAIGGAGGVTGNPLRGWAWNTNLGYVSFSCSGGDNLGGGCGNVDYQSIIASDGQVHGWAWGDNIGWVSFYCEGGRNLGLPCGGAGINYGGVKVAQDAALESAAASNAGCAIDERGDFYGYAWTETVGWINFCGAHVDLASSLTPTLDTEPNPADGEPAPGGPGGGLEAGGPPVYANGVDSHLIIVQLSQNGAILTENPNNSGHIVTVNALHWNNGGATTLRADQVTRCSPVDGTGRAACVYNGAILPAVTSFAWDDARDGFAAHVRAIAPTSDTDRIVLEAADIAIDGTTYRLDALNTAGSALRLPYSFSFLPAVSVNSIHSQDSGRVDAVRGTSEPVSVEASAVRRAGDVLPADNANINIFVQLYDCSPDFDFRFDDNAAEELGVSRDEMTGTLGDQNLGDSADRQNFDRPEEVCTVGSGGLGSGELADIASNTSFAPLTTVSLFADIRNADSTAPLGVNVDNAFGFRTRVEYNAAGAGAPLVRYFSLLLPDQSLLNQSADVRGNVRIDIQKIIREGAIAQSLKNNPKDTQSKREKFYRAIKNTLNTRNVSLLPGESVPSDGAFAFANSTGLAAGLRYFNTTNIPGSAPCKIILDDAATINFENNVTLVAEGCDFFIDQNIMAEGANRGRLGIIALEDLSLSGPRRGGNVYVCHRVRDVEANIVADGSIFAYGAGETDCDGEGATAAARKDDLLDADGLPSPRGTRDTALRQLTVVGSIVSNNTYGGAFMSPPILGDGTRVTNPSDIPRARLYDMNFLRYARTREPTEEEIDALDVNPAAACWVNTPDQLSALLGPPTCENNRPDNPDLGLQGYGIINIIYRAPAKDMKIFGAIR